MGEKIKLKANRIVVIMDGETVYDGPNDVPHRAGALSQFIIARAKTFDNDSEVWWAERRRLKIQSLLDARVSLPERDEDLDLKALGYPLVAAPSPAVSPARIRAAARRAVRRNS